MTAEIRRAQAAERAKALRAAGKREVRVLDEKEQYAAELGRVYDLANPMRCVPAWREFPPPGEIEMRQSRACLLRAVVARELARVKKSEIWRRLWLVELRNARRFADEARRARRGGR